MSFSSRFFINILIISTVFLFLSFLLAGADRVFGIIYPPRVINVFPATDSQNIPLDSQLVIKFNKPVSRQDLNYSIVPEALGEWEFKDPIIKSPASPAGGHLFRASVFSPASPFLPDTNYRVKIEKIKSLGGKENDSFSFSFRTEKSETATVANVENSSSTASSSQPEITLIKTVFNWQKYRLSCEAASLKMALSAKGITVSEDEIMAKIGYDLTPHENGIWGDPNIAFVGDINGKIGITGYGVYWDPVAKAANNWRESEAFSNWNLKKLVAELLAGNPVIIWGTLPVEPIHDISWLTPKGKFIKAYQEDHVRLAVGFIGSPENPTKIIINDPLSGKLYWDTSYFLVNWSAFDYSGVVIR